MRRQIHVNPRRLVGETLQQPRGENVIGLAVERALLDVGHRAVEGAVVIIIHRKHAHALTGHGARGHGARRPRRGRREYAAVAAAQRDMHGAGQRRKINDHARFGARRQRQRVGQHHAALGIGMHDFDGGAVQRGDNVVLFVGARTDVVLRQRQPAVDVDLEFCRRRRSEYAQRHRRTVHVFMHALHVARRLQVVAAGVETDAFADQRHGFFGTPRPVAQPHDGRVVLVAALRHRAERAGAHFAQTPEVVFFACPAVLFGEHLHPFAVCARRQFVRRQHGQLAAQHIAFSLRTDCRKAVGGTITIETDALERFRISFIFVLRLALRQRDAVDPGHIHGQFRQRTALRRGAGDDQRQFFRMLGEQQPRRLAHQRLLLEHGFLQVRRHPHRQRTVRRIGTHRRRGQIGDFLAAAAERLAQQFPQRQRELRGAAGRNHQQMTSACELALPRP